MTNRDKRLSRIVVVFMAALWASQAPAAEQTAIEGALKRGFDEKSVFAGGDLDNVNLFNGNLAVSIPLGQAYQAGPALSYQLALSYNSRAWDFEEFNGFYSEGHRQDGQTQKVSIGFPMRDANAGLGWQVSLGRLYPPDPTAVTSGSDHLRVNSGSKLWLYVSSDGAHHKLRDNLRETVSAADGMRYTQDSTYLRMRTISDRHKVIDLPDGTSHHFECSAGLSVDEEACWKLSYIEDQYQNLIMFDTIEYSNNAGYEWVITEIPASGTGRTQSLHFDYVFNRPYKSIIKSIELTSIGGEPLVYEFEYVDQSVLRGCHPNLLQAWNNYWNGTVVPENINVHFLSRIIGPEGTEYSFDYEARSTLEQGNLGGDCVKDNGRLTKAVLPTGGSVQWDYGQYLHAPFDCGIAEEFEDVEPPARRTPTVEGVVARREVTAAGIVLTEARYQPFRFDDYKERRNDPPPLPGGVSTCYITSRQFTNSVKSVDVPKSLGHSEEATIAAMRAKSFDELIGDVTVSYFNLYNEDTFYTEGSANDNPDIADPDGFVAADPEQGWKDEEYGLPFTRYHSDHFIHETIDTTAGTQEVYLSTEQYDCSVEPTPANLASNAYRPPSVDHCKRVRASYKAWERDAIGNADRPLNVRYPHSKTVFHDDLVKRGTELEATWISESSSDFDGFGNYRKSEKRSDFGSANSYSPKYTRSTYVEYFVGGATETTLPRADDLWLLGRAKRQQVTEGPKTAETWICYNANGSVLSRRTLSGWNGAASGNDVVIQFEHNAGGYPVLAYYHGGDSDPLPVPAARSCDSTGYGAAEYVLGAKYDHGVVSRLAWLNPSSARSNFTHSDELLLIQGNVVDAGTGLVTSTHGASGVLVRASYDVLGRIISERSGEQVATRYEYCMVGKAGCSSNKVTVTRNEPGDANQADGGSRPLAIYHYDDLGRLVKQDRRQGKSYSSTGIASAEDVSRIIVYDGYGRPHKESGFATTNHLTETIFNRGTGSVRQVNRPDGTASRYRQRGSRIQEVRTATVTPEGMADIFKRSKMDEHGRTVIVAECSVGGSIATSCDSANLVHTHYRYDPLGNIIGVGLGTLLETDRAYRSFEYDGAGRLLVARHPELDVIERHTDYDSRGKVLASRLEYRGTGGLARELTYSYDAAGRLTQHWAEEGGIKKRLVQNYYAPTKHAVQSAGDRNGGKLVRTQRHTQTYLSMGQLSNGNPSEAIVSELYLYGGPAGQLTGVTTRVAVVDGDTGNHLRSSHDFASEYTYDSAGLLVQTSYPRCVGDCTDFPTGFGIEYLRGRPMTLSIDGRVAGRLTYHSTGELATIRHNTASGAASVQHFTPDPWGMGRIRRTYVTTPAGMAWDTGAYHYDASRNIYAIGDSQYRYDLAGRLVIGETHTQDGGFTLSDYVYDKNGNLIARTVDGQGTDLAVNSDTNRLLASTYDPYGNMLHWGANGFAEYDAENMATMMIVGEGNHIRQRSFIYAPGNYRIATIDLDSGEERWTLRNGSRKILREYDRDFYSAPLAWNQDNFYSGSQLFASDSAADGERHYYADHLGSTRLVTTEAAVTETRYDYLPYGQTAYEWNDATAIDSVRQRFTGHERDPLCQSGSPCQSDAENESLDYLLARFNSPKLGRFLSPDPASGNIASPASWNRYVYSAGNPIRLLDPDGLSPEEQTTTTWLIFMHEVKTSRDKNGLARDVKHAIEGHQVTFDELAFEEPVTITSNGPLKGDQAILSNYSITDGNSAGYGVGAEKTLAKTTFTKADGWIPQLRVTAANGTTRIWDFAKVVGKKTAKVLPFVGLGMAANDARAAETGADRFLAIANGAVGEVPGVGDLAELLMPNSVNDAQNRIKQMSSGDATRHVKKSECAKQNVPHC